LEKVGLECNLTPEAADPEYKPSLRLVEAEDTLSLDFGYDQEMNQYCNLA